MEVEQEEVEQKDLDSDEELENSVLQAQAKAMPQTSNSKSLDAEFKSLEKSGQLTPNLKLLCDALLNIPPTSVMSERAFSTTNCFFEDKRFRLSDQHLSDLVFLKSYFKRVETKENDTK